MPILVTSPNNVRYLTGFTGSNAQLLLSGEPVFFTDGRYGDQSALEVADLPRKVYDKAAMMPSIREACAQQNLTEIGVESNHMTLALRERYSSGLELSLVAVGNVLERQRAIKEPEEIASIKKAQRIAEKALADIISDRRSGTERELALDIEWQMRTNGSDGLAFDVIVASGAQAAFPHAIPGDHPVADEPLLIDLGARVNGYCSDMTRTWVRSGSDELKRIFDIVLRALDAACVEVAGGTRAASVDKAARDLIASEGYAEQYVHGTGHGVGLEVHEWPGLSRASEDVLAPGMVVTVEPGIYVPGVGGVRIEDLLLVTDDGFESLTEFPRSG